jgi:TRAP-type uncharacterized transport system substrate-binding protein
MKKEDQGPGFTGLATICTEYFGLNRAVSLAVVGLFAVIVCFAIFWFIRSAPPRVITITCGPAGSAFDTNASKYATILASNGVTLKILHSQGSWENLKRLEDPKAHVDIGFVQGGIADGTNTANLVSLGSISYEPLLVFYRGTNTITFLSQFEGKRLAVGSEGSGTHLLAMALLETNGISPGGSTVLEDLDAGDAAQALLAGTVDAVFLTSDSASSQTMRTLLRAPGVQLMSFEQADAYTRRFNYLNKLRLPEGVIDFNKNLPPHDVWLVGPTVELVVRPDLNPAMSDLLLDAAQTVHGKASIFQSQGEFPAPLVHEYTISPDALRYYKSGKKFLYREMPFWIASLVNRVMVAFVPIVLVLIPALRLFPAAYRWRAQLRIYRWYRKLLVLERDVALAQNPSQQEDFVRRLDEIETVVLAMKVPASFANLFYSLREHIDYVRAKLASRSSPPKV